MKIVVFGPDRRVGALVGTDIVDINRAFELHLAREGRAGSGTQVTADVRTPPRLVEFIAAGAMAIDNARDAIDIALAEGPESGLLHPAATTQLHAPWARRRIACVGGNFARHLMGMFRDRPGHEDDTVESVTRSTRDDGQWGFWKVPDEVVGPDGDVPFPAHARLLDYEGELAVVIGRPGANIAADKFDRHVWGVTLLNDWSKRDRRGGTPKPMSYNTAKNFDGSTSMGPCIVVGELDPHDVEIETRVNGEVRQHFSTADMIFGFGEIIEHLSTDFTFVPGDVISGGTGAGTAADSRSELPDAESWFLSPGDVVEVESGGVGVLRNRIVAVE